MTAAALAKFYTIRLRKLLHLLSWGNSVHNFVEKRGVERGSARRSFLKDTKGPSSIRPTLELFQRQCWGNFWEMGRSAYGLFQKYKYHPEATWRPQLTNGVGGRFLALLVHPVVARHRAVRSLRLHSLSIRADQHTRHHSQRTKPCSTDITINNHTNDRLFLIPTQPNSAAQTPSSTSPSQYQRQTLPHSHTAKLCSTDIIINVTITILKTDSSSFPQRQNLCKQTGTLWSCYTRLKNTVNVGKFTGHTNFYPVIQD